MRDYLAAAQTIQTLKAAYEKDLWEAGGADLVVGTSAGAGAGALLRGGVSPADLVARARGDPLSDEGHAILGSFC